MPSPALGTSQMLMTRDNPSPPPPKKGTARPMQRFIAESVHPAEGPVSASPAPAKRAGGACPRLQDRSRPRTDVSECWVTEGQRGTGMREREPWSLSYSCQGVGPG